MTDTLQEQHLCDKKVFGYIEIKKSPIDGWILWIAEAPETEIKFCPYCGADLDPDGEFIAPEPGTKE